MANAPIQVILQADSYRKDRETQRPGSAGMDFFAGRDGEFEVHREQLAEQVRSIQRQIADPEWANKYGDVGYVKVTMRSSALAKSHRPTRALFPAQRTPSVGSDELGQLIYEASSNALGRVDDAIARAEPHVRMRQKGDELIPAPSRYRCEVGAIEKVEAWRREDKRRFAVDEALQWLANPRTGQSYLVELFDRPPPFAQWDALPEAKRKLYNSFLTGLKELGSGLEARMVEGLPVDAIFIEVRLSQSTEPPAVFVAPGPGGRERVRARFDDRKDRHEKLLAFLEQHPLVRYIRLPLELVRTATTQPKKEGALKVVLPARNGSQSYPRVGVIDGGLTAHLTEWVRNKWGLLANEHEDLRHGTFIGGLLVAGKGINGEPVCGEPDGCDLVDVNIFPDESKPAAFAEYYPGGLSDFFDELERAVETARTQYGTRIFNMSLNAVSPVDLDKYSLEARRLDRIADLHDVVFVISAGNLGRNARNEWPNDETQAAAILAAHRDDQLFIPAESIRNLSVAALNVPGLSNSIAEAPARYSRRGPGLRTGVKPDLCHFGGSGTRCPTKGHGLHSISPSGYQIDGCGTSYSAPLVAKTLATLENSIEGIVSRETLLALAAHHATLPTILQTEGLSGVARQLVGFGRPSTAAATLAGSDNQITMLFASRLYDGKMLEFRFTWPPSLVGSGGKCKGDVFLTLVATPPLDFRYGAEFVRVNIEAPLQQEQKNGKFKGVLEPTYVFFNDDEKTTEADLIEHKFKWAPIKAFGKKIVRGIGSSSNFRLLVNYLTRADEHLPAEGVPFSVLLTIADPDGEKPVFQEMRQTLQLAGVNIADIRTAARVTPRV
jgi:hypothetical protein